MTNALIVTHCLALLNQHSGAMTQADKDFFDARVDQVTDQSDDIFVAVLLLLTMRLSLELPEREAEEISQHLAQMQAQQFGYQTRT